MFVNVQFLSIITKHKTELSLQFNRDISICVLNTYLKKAEQERNEKNPDQSTAKKVRVLEALSATGEIEHFVIEHED